MEFVLLSHIAATRSSGILQGPLGRASGQDKRSVPKRTDALHQKGYIIKETVYTQGNKTSRLTLRKFAASTNRPMDLAQTTTSQAQRPSTVRDVVRRVFDELSKQDIIPQIDLAAQLDMSSAAKTTVFGKIIRRLDRLKLTKKVKTAFGPAASTGDVKQCVQMLRPIDAESLNTFDTDGLSLDQSIADISSALGIDEPLEPTIEVDRETEGDPSPSQPRAIAKWNPDRLMPNILSDATKVQGMEGMTNLVSILLLCILR